LRARRETIGASRQQVAVAAGVSLRTVERAERGEAKPRPVVAAALASALGVKVDALVREVERR
jgi:transcriptional regulator with XRE-family HTH domain